ncbi:hypothetical protein D3C85_1657040 [compost metagenome]
MSDFEELFHVLGRLIASIYDGIGYVLLREHNHVRCCQKNRCISPAFVKCLTVVCIGADSKAHHCLGYDFHSLVNHGSHFRLRYIVLLSYHFSIRNNS